MSENRRGDFFDSHCRSISMLMNDLDVHDKGIHSWFVQYSTDITHRQAAHQHVIGTEQTNHSSWRAFGQTAPLVPW